MKLAQYLKICILLLLVSCSNQIENIEPNYIIELDEFLETYQSKNIKIIDFRNPEVYAEKHIKGAININRSDIEDTSYPYGGMMASKKQIESLFSRLGITNSDVLFVYDNKGLCDATRLWWILQNYGFTNIRMLNGGLSNWLEHGNELTNKIPRLVKSNFIFQNKEKGKFIVNKEQVLAAINTEIVILDTRTNEEFAGNFIKNGAYKAGRILNSKSIDWSNAIDDQNSKKIKEINQLKHIYSEFLSSKNDSIIVYCHSGVRSAHTTFILTQVLGYKNVFNYDGSWIEWSYFDEYPIEKDTSSFME